MEYSNTTTNVCPECGADAIVRTRRSAWMRLFSNSVAIRCCKCGEVSMLRNPPPALREQSRMPSRLGR